MGLEAGEDKCRFGTDILQLRIPEFKGSDRAEIVALQLHGEVSFCSVETALIETSGEQTRLERHDLFADARPQQVFRFLDGSFGAAPLDHGVFDVGAVAEAIEEIERERQSHGSVGALCADITRKAFGVVRSGEPVGVAVVGEQTDARQKRRS